MPDYYALFGLAADASQDALKKEYHLLLLAWHPDRFPDEQKAQAAAKTREIIEAYKVLSNPQKRREYDQERQNDRSEAERRRTDQSKEQERQERAEAERQRQEQQRQEQERRAREEAEEARWAYDERPRHQETPADFGKRVVFLNYTRQQVLVAVGGLLVFMGCLLLFARGRDVPLTSAPKVHGTVSRKDNDQKASGKPTTIAPPSVAREKSPRDPSARTEQSSHDLFQDELAKTIKEAVTQGLKEPGHWDRKVLRSGVVNISGVDIQRLPPDFFKKESLEAMPELARATHLVTPNRWVGGTVLYFFPDNEGNVVIDRAIGQFQQFFIELNGIDKCALFLRNPLEYVNDPSLGQAKVAAVIQPIGSPVDRQQKQGAATESPRPIGKASQQAQTQTKTIFPPPSGGKIKPTPCREPVGSATREQRIEYQVCLATQPRR